jgi:hypothetical protein
VEFVQAMTIQGLTALHRFSASRNFTTAAGRAGAFRRRPPNNASSGWESKWLQIHPPARMAPALRIRGTRSLRVRLAARPSFSDSERARAEEPGAARALASHDPQVMPCVTRVIVGDGLLQVNLPLVASGATGAAALLSAGYRVGVRVSAPGKLQRRSWTLVARCA